MRLLIFGFVQMLLLISCALAAIPTGCVKIKNAKHGYLSTMNKHDTERRNVGTSVAEKWNIIQQDNYYFIEHHGLGEALYAANGHFAKDDDRRTVFTWMDGTWWDKSKWYIEELGAGRFLIENQYYGEYLYAADYPTTWSVFTWRGSGYMRDNSKFQWYLIQC